MAEFFEYDPLKKTTSYFDYDEATGVARINTVQDVEPYLERAKYIRNNGLSDDNLKDDNFMCLYAILPPVVQMELMDKGINISNPHQSKELMKEINSNYPHLKTTNYRA